MFGNNARIDKLVKSVGLDPTAHMITFTGSSPVSGTKMFLWWKWRYTTVLKIVAFNNIWVRVPLGIHMFQ